MFVFALKFGCVGFSRTWFNCMVSGCRYDSNNQPLLAYSEKHNYTDIFLLLFVVFFFFLESTHSNEEDESLMNDDYPNAMQS